MKLAEKKWEKNALEKYQPSQVAISFFIFKMKKHSNVFFSPSFAMNKVFSQLNEEAINDEVLNFIENSRKCDIKCEWGKKTILTSSHQRVVSFGYGKVPNEWRRMHLPAHSTKLKSSKYSLCWLFILTVQMSSLAIRFGVGSVFPVSWRSKLSSWKFWLIKSNKFISIANGCIFIVFVP